MKRTVSNFYEGAAAMVSSILHCYFCGKRSEDATGFPVCGHVICHRCIVKPGCDKCPVCGKEATNREMDGDPTFMRLRQLTVDLEGLVKLPQLDRGVLPMLLPLACMKVKFESEVEKDQEMPPLERSHSSGQDQAADKTTSPRVTPMMLNKYQKKKAASTNKRTCQGQRTLHMACNKGDFNQVELLIANGTSANSCDYSERTALHKAAHHGHVSIARCLIAAGAPINAKAKDGMTPLHEAVKQDHLTMVKLLVQLGAHTDTRDAKGKMPIDLTDCTMMHEELTSGLMLLPTILPLPVNQSTMCILEDGLTSATRQIQLRVVTHKLDLKLTDLLTEDVTHVISQTYAQNACKPSGNVLQAMLMGATIINDRWVALSSQADSFVDPLPFEVSGTIKFPTSQAPSRARFNSLNQWPGLFYNCNFYIRPMSQSYNNGYDSLSEPFLVKLIQMAGGTVLSEEPKPHNVPTKHVMGPYHAEPGGPLEECTHFIIYQKGEKVTNKYNLRYMKSLPMEWLVDCLETFCLRYHPLYMGTAAKSSSAKNLWHESS